MPTITALKEIKDRIEFVVHDAEQKNRLTDGFGISSSNIHVTGVDVGFLGIAGQRDFILDRLVTPGEWYVSVDDNIEYVTRLIDPHYSMGENPPEAKREYFAHRVDGVEFMSLCDELMEKCAAQETIYGGFGWLDVPFYRMKKWRWNGYVKAKAIVHQADGVGWRWNERIQIMSDHAKTYDTLARYGSVVVNQHVYVDAKRWSVGGIGTHEERMPGRVATCAFLYEHFGDMIKRGKEFDDPKFTFTSRSRFDEWRAAQGYNV